ncbi:hypothetical protein CEXT_782531 [Caerostris extrusa]|uniref:Uncharacterized protein n=1 Tax=Caerostris extrusa TaxID=172846 RepID=A0AAV4MKX7_CAEEX|nr:hypothetical protein CEXT_782531 [Caerostris extrusa]
MIPVVCCSISLSVIGPRLVSAIRRVHLQEVEVNLHTGRDLRGEMARKFNWRADKSGLGILLTLLFGRLCDTLDFRCRSRVKGRKSSGVEVKLHAGRDLREEVARKFNGCADKSGLGILLTLLFGRLLEHSGFSGVTFGAHKVICCCVK